MMKARGFEPLDMQKEEARSKIENGETDDLNVAVEFALDDFVHDGLVFLMGWRTRNWEYLRVNWPEWVPFLRKKFPHYYVD